MPKQTISPLFTQIKKLPKVFADRAAVDMKAFTEKIKELAVALKPLADEMNKVAAGFFVVPIKGTKTHCRNKENRNGR